MSSWQNTVIKLSEKLAYVLDSGRCSDVTIVVGKPPQQKKFMVHRFMLSVYSEVLSVYFYGAMAFKGNELELPEDDPDSFHIMIKYIYSHCISFSSVEQTVSLCFLADKYMVSQLKKECIDYLKKNIHSYSSRVDLCTTHNMANLLNIEELSTKCSQLLKDSLDCIDV